MSVFDPRWHEKLKQAFLEAIEESKPSYEDVKWHEETIPLSKAFGPVPKGKLYEVFVFLVGNQQVNDVKNRLVAINYGINDSWFPQLNAVLPGYVNQWVTADAGITYDATLTASAASTICKSDHGLILSEDDILKEPIAVAPFVVQWRDVTKLYCRT